MTNRTALPSTKRQLASTSSSDNNSYKRVTIRAFLAAIEAARSVNHLVKLATSALSYEDLEGCELYLSGDGLSGFGIRQGELINVFSSVQGRGDSLVKMAKILGANHLDCFNGYLVSFYQKAGFIEYKREANWIEGEPSVVYMSLNLSNTIGE